MSDFSTKYPAPFIQSRIAFNPTPVEIKKTNFDGIDIQKNIRSYRNVTDEVAKKAKDLKGAGKDVDKAENAYRRELNKANCITKVALVAMLVVSLAVLILVPLAGASVIALELGFWLIVGCSVVGSVAIYFKNKSCKQSEKCADQLKDIENLKKMDKYLEELTELKKNIKVGKAPEEYTKFLEQFKANENIKVEQLDEGTKKNALDIQIEKHIQNLRLKPNDDTLPLLYLFNKHELPADYQAAFMDAPGAYFKADPEVINIIEEAQQMRSKEFMESMDSELHAKKIQPFFGKIIGAKSALKDPETALGKANEAKELASKELEEAKKDTSGSTEAKEKLVAAEKKKTESEDVFTKAEKAFKVAEKTVQDAEQAAKEVTDKFEAAKKQNVEFEAKLQKTFEEAEARALEAFNFALPETKPVDTDKSTAVSDAKAVDKTKTEENIKAEEKAKADAKAKEELREVGVLLFARLLRDYGTFIPAQALSQNVLGTGTAKPIAQEKIPLEAVKA